jgi:NAD(P)-dependent dehydrogenase (short-subunit alcohol dehydrogenase family)
LGTLSGKVAIISGAGRGIGRGIALALAREGASICIAEIDPDTGPATAREIEKLGVRAIAVCCDVKQRDQIEQCVATVVSELGGVDILINNATGANQETAFRPLIEHTEEQFDRQFAVDVKGTFHFMVACYPHFCARGGGAIVNLASEAGSERTQGFGAYAAAKEAVRALTGVAAREWGPQGIRVNAICPTAITPATSQWLADNPEHAEEHLSKIPLQRHGDPEHDTGRTVVFLVGPDASFMTGQTIWIDGGSVIHA